MPEIKSYEEFCQYVEEHIAAYLPPDFDKPQIVTVEKTNRKAESALVVKQKGQYASPIVYMADWYNEYQKGEDLGQILSGIGKQRMSYEPLPNLPYPDFESMKDRIIIETIGAENMENRTLLETVPHRIYGDIAAVYRVDFGPATALINHGMMKSLGMTTKELHDLAVKNTENRYPPEFRSINEVLGEMVGTPVEPLPLPFYVLRSENDVSGASAIFYPHIFERVAEKVGKDFWIIPSSTHEVLILSRSDQMDLNEMNLLIQEVNRTQVNQSEQLSNVAYEYDFSRKRLCISGTSEQVRDLEIAREQEFDQKEKEEFQKREAKSQDHRDRGLR